MNGRHRERPAGRARRCAPLPRALARLAVATALLGCDVTFGRGSYGARAGRACDAYWPHDAAAPLPLGDSLRLVVGHLSDVQHECVAPAPGAVRWVITDTAVAAVAPDGWLVGRGAGAFAVRALAASVVRGVAHVDTLTLEGFVLPRDYRARVVPESATAVVGDTVVFEVRAEDAHGTLPPVPYQLREERDGPRALRRPGEPRPPAPVPLAEVLGPCCVAGPRRVVALRPGVTQVEGVIGSGVLGRPSAINQRRARASLRVLPARPAPAAGG